ncbi:MAG TPA: nicotinate (nicotinamide) nucleotide adenylyltransferase [Cyclobacteriaceae bacterium]|nr:nicotinate-nucleotide adenylyltransferase [Cyclobacteriaceae bacterium]HMV08209.1 nicotinate (nicotinamide) nucleotide adenylyltransferase [Cyclobacteriaceae bacterium]HMV89089.1 nicotinate (nicotinamide) nucleotide adenylyltransferase [Cyclobacteriaceae bacterium]HMX02052.1 nicotinate (nicotinamide) nucleotide adenylyltransferase [Cyclobacteriaceae bacterium]HMX49972.1 nicotinate (nicotinamide) nucleotide adenylyltransferase [Cyclobacteriaceae bacterium]
MKVGLFFGSFNPIHIGHLIVANIMAETTDLDKVWFVVTPHNPLKPSKSLLHDFDRYDMVRAAVYEHYKLQVSDVEFHLPKPNYTIHTLIHLSEKHPDKQFKVIIGEDNLHSFTRWKNYERILEDYGLYVYPRLQAPEAAVTIPDLRRHPNVRMVEAPLMDISATFIRNCIKKGQSVRYLVPDSVEAIIRDKKFYQ